MTGIRVLLEIASERPDALEMHSAAVEGESEAERQAADLLSDVGGAGIELDQNCTPIPMFLDVGASPGADFIDSVQPLHPELAPVSRTMILPAEISRERLDDLRGNPNVSIWPNSPLTLFSAHEAMDSARSDGGVDCRPFRDAVDLAVLRDLLGTDMLWDSGYRGQSIVVGILDEGVNGDEYPVIGGFARPGAFVQPGAAAITSHGSMCAADVLVAAPAARLYDYPFLGIPNSGGALQMFQAVLNQWNIDGTPQITNNSYGFAGVPDPAQAPNHEIHDINHPLHRKVREVVSAGVACFFAAGNCGQNCPSGRCHPSGIGPGVSIHASNSLEEVITVAAVNSRHERIGYSSQGPGMFEPQKPDVASYSHFFGNFGPGRPAGTAASAFDNGTSAATPVAAGVGAALLSANPGLTPAELKLLLMDTAIDIGRSVGWDADHGRGVVNAAAAFSSMRGRLPLVG
ncbi:S8 family peptidase [Ruegeria jejuensis]|uniref:S8 family peptidase n=1 Tax=Ruegeria jejuensis TaxID=3233338 RepID=UPI00355C0DFD